MAVSEKATAILPSLSVWRSGRFPQKHGHLLSAVEGEEAAASLAIAQANWQYVLWWGGGLGDAGRPSHSHRKKEKEGQFTRAYTIHNSPIIPNMGHRAVFLTFIT